MIVHFSDHRLFVTLLLTFASVNEICVEVFSKTKATHTTNDIPIAGFMHALWPALGRMQGYVVQKPKDDRHKY